MNKLEMFKDKIELLRSELDQAIGEGRSKEVIYEKSLALDQVLEEYYELDEGDSE